MLVDADPYHPCNYFTGSDDPRVGTFCDSNGKPTEASVSDLPEPKSIDCTPYAGWFLLVVTPCVSNDAWRCQVGLDPLDPTSDCENMQSKEPPKSTGSSSGGSSNAASGSGSDSCAGFNANNYDVLTEGQFHCALENCYKENPDPESRKCNTCPSDVRRDDCGFSESEDGLKHVIHK